MRALIIDTETESKIKNVIHYAEENLFGMKYALDVIGSKLAPPNRDSKRVVVIPVGFRTEYSLVDLPFGTYRRISISVPVAGKLPSIIAAQEIIKEFGFIGVIGDGTAEILIQNIGAGEQAIQ